MADIVIDFDSKRKQLYSIVGRETTDTKTQKPLDFKTWSQFFVSDKNLNGYFNFLNSGYTGNYNSKNIFVRNKSLKIIDADFKITDDNSKKWRESVTNKISFIQNYACDQSWAQQSNFCSGIIPAGNSAGYVSDEYVGSYSDVKTNASIDVTSDNGSNALNVIMYGNKCPLTHTAGEIFTFSIDMQLVKITGSIIFKKDPKTLQVTGFHYKLDKIPDIVKKYLPSNFEPEGDAVKDSVNTNTGGGSTGNSHEWDYFKGLSNSPYPKQSDSNKSYEQNGTPKEKTLKADTNKVIMPKDVHPCDENADSWEIGCKNSKIAYISQKILGRSNDGVYTEELNHQLLSAGFLFRKNDKITKELYDKIKSMNLQESVIKKVVIKNLKELINRNL